MKPITLHPVSIVAGLGLAALVFLATGAQVSIPARQVVLGVVPAERWVFIEVATPNSYVVPADRRLVITRATWSSDPTVNGLNVRTKLSAVGTGGSTGPWTDVGNTRVVLQPGDVLATPDSAPTLKIWGYLEPL